MSDSPSTGRRRAREWPYARYQPFRSTVAEAAAQWFVGREFEVDRRYPYILARRDDWPKNILVREVADYVDQKKREKLGSEPFPLHKYIHHGLSSQALLFNLVGPLLLQGDMTPLISALRAHRPDIPDVAWNPELEYGSRDTFNEASGQPTSIDLALLPPASSTGGIFIECKFVEREFGTCSVFQGGDCDGRNPTADLDKCYLHFIGRTYWQVAAEHGLLDGPIRTEALCPFAFHYQLFRELLLAAKHDGIFVLLSDARSPVFYQTGPLGDRGLIPAVTAMLPESLKERVVLLTVQDVLGEIRQSLDPDWVPGFERKYGMDGKEIDGLLPRHRR